MAQHSIKLELSPEQSHTLDVERRRLEALYGVKVTRPQIVRILIEQHRLKLRLTAEQDVVPDMLAWLWRKKSGEAD